MTAAGLLGEFIENPGRDWRGKLEVCEQVGHPLEGDNLILRPAPGKPGKFYRQCRECGRARQRAYYKRKRGLRESNREG